jgi:DNA helicase TIP49 (TBP-interacting protein)
MIDCKPLLTGTDMNAPHGVPVDLLDRLVIIRTLPYTAEEMVKILAVRATVEGLQVRLALLSQRYFAVKTWFQIDDTASVFHATNLTPGGSDNPAVKTRSIDDSQCVPCNQSDAPRE